MFIQAIAVVTDPMNGSRTTSTTPLKNLIANSGMLKGKGAVWFNIFSPLLLIFITGFILTISLLNCFNKVSSILFSSNCFSSICLCLFVYLTLLPAFDLRHFGFLLSFVYVFFLISLLTAMFLLHTGQFGFTLSFSNFLKIKICS